MGSLSSNEQRKMAYFHALGKSMVENQQAVYESKYKSSHNVRLSEVWADDISYALTYTDAVNESLVNSAVTHHNQVVLTEILGSNGQTYAFISGSTFIRPWISPVDVPDSITNEPSYGYTVKLFRGSNATSGVPNSEIYLTEGAWAVDYYTGTIHFSNGDYNYTPQNLGWGDIKATFFQYTGSYGVGMTSDSLKTVVFNSGTNELVFNSGLSNEQIVSLNSLTGSTVEGAYVSAIFDNSNNTIVFNSGLSGMTTLDLSSLTGLTTAYFDSGNSLLVFNQGLIGELVLNLSSLKGGGSGGGYLSSTNRNMSSLTVTGDNELACSSGILSNPITGSTIAVFINGLQVNLGDGVKTDDCYFSNDGGITAKNFSNVELGDLLYWNASIAGYGLDSTIDKITFMYLTF